MKSEPSFMMILMYIPFFFAAYESRVISRRDVDKTVQKVNHQFMKL